MRRPLLGLLLVPLVLAACGGGGDDGPKGSGNPLADAAEATAAAVSETTTTTSTLTYPGAAFRLVGNGGYNHSTDEGWQHLTVKLPNAIDSMDQIFVKNRLWMKSDQLIATLLPKGKQWLEYDVNQADETSGYNFKALLGQSPADVLRQLQRTKVPVTTIGTETIDGVETTHYRATIDPKQVPSGDNLQALSKAIYKPVDVWVDDDGLVRQAELDYTAVVDPAQTVRARVKLKMKLADFGATVDVDPPPTNLVVNATDDSGQTG